MSVNIQIKLEGHEEAIALLEQCYDLVDILTFEGLKAGVKAVVQVAKDDAPSKTGELRDSLGILSENGVPGLIQIEAGSTILGYPFWQEYGWTTSTGAIVPPKLFFTKAIELVGNQLPEKIQSKLAVELPGFEGS